MIFALSSIVPMLIGIGAGILYGYSFVIQQRSMFFQSNQTRAASFFIVRILIMSFVGSYLLRSPVIPSILGVLGFVVIFWSVLLIKKANLYEEH